MSQFSEFITEHARGQVDDEATATLVDLIAAVTATGKKGSMSVVIDVKPSGTRMVQVSASVTAKNPEPDAEVGVFYVDSDGHLRRDDPYQERLPIADIDPSGPTRVHVVDNTGAVRDVDLSTGEIIAGDNQND